MRKKEKWNKVISLGLVAVLTVTLLGGCGNQAGNAGTGGESEADAAASGEQAQGEDLFDFASVSDVVFPLKEKLNLTVFVKSIATGGGTYQDNYVTDWIEEKTNIHLDFVYDLDGDEAKTKLNLLMTDPDSIPDILWTTGWTKAETQSYGQQGLILPLNDYLEDAPNWNKLNESSPARRADLVLSDGNIYTYGDENECFHCLYDNRMWIYKPWVDSLNGGKMPETLDELYDFLVKVKTQDPNGNGKADEIPVSGYLGGWTTDPTVWFINSFLQCDNPLSNTTIDQGAGMVVNADGKIEYAVMKEEYRDALRFLNKIYEEGLVDSQVFTQDGTQFSATMENEENLVALHPGGTMSPEIGKLYGREDGKWQDWEVLEPVEGPNGVRLAARGRSLYFGSAVGIR